MGKKVPFQMFLYLPVKMPVVEGYLAGWEGSRTMLHVDMGKQNLTNNIFLLIARNFILLPMFHHINLPTCSHGHFSKVNPDFSVKKYFQVKQHMSKK